MASSGLQEPLYTPWLYPFDFMVSDRKPSGIDYTTGHGLERKFIHKYLYPAIPASYVYTAEMAQIANSEHPKQNIVEMAQFADSEHSKGVPLGLFFTDSLSSRGILEEMLQNDSGSQFRALSERLILPRAGESYEECGRTKMAVSCKNGDYPVKLIPHDCGRPECPVCSSRWVKRTALRSTEKIMASLDLSKQLVNPNFSLSSVIISPPENLWNADYDTLKASFRGIQGKLGTNHIAATLHLWRFRDLTKDGEILEAIPWREYQAHPERYVRIISPHFHCIIMGQMTNSKRFYEKTGWVYKKLGGYLSESDVYGIISYALSHTAISLDRQRKTIDYYGLIRRTRIESEEIEWEPVMCPFCGLQLQITHLYDRIALGENINGLTEPYYRKVVTRIWSLGGLNAID